MCLPELCLWPPLPIRGITAVFTTLRNGFFHPGCTYYPHEYPWEQRGMLQRGFWEECLAPKAQQGRQGLGLMGAEHPTAARAPGPLE